VVFGTVVCVELRWIERKTVALTFAPVIAWILLNGIGAPDVKGTRLLTALWSNAQFAAPVLFSAFGYHNVIPSLASYLKRDRKVLHRSVLIGTLLSLVVYLVWQWLIIGSLTTAQLLEIKQQGLPVTEALARVTQNKSVAFFCNTFALFAIVTSVLGVSFSLVDFLGDGIKKRERKGWTRVFLTAMTFVPPFIIASINPHIFDSALGIAGGFGEAFLNGLLPILLVWFGHYVHKNRLHLIKKRIVFVLLSFAAILVMILEALELMH